jgi:hypothetical protein
LLPRRNATGATIVSPFGPRTARYKMISNAVVGVAAVPRRNDYDVAELGSVQLGSTAALDRAHWTAEPSIERGRGRREVG